MKFDKIVFQLNIRPLTESDFLYHRLNGSSSPVLTETPHFCGSLCDFITFSRINLEVTPLKRTNVPFEVKTDILYPVTLRPPKAPKFGQFWSGLKPLIRRSRGRRS